MTSFATPPPRQPFVRSTGRSFTRPRRMLVVIAASMLMIAGLPAGAVSAQEPPAPPVDALGFTVIQRDGEIGCDLARLDTITGEVVDLPADASVVACVVDLAVHPDGTVWGLSSDSFDVCDIGPGICARTPSGDSIEISQSVEQVTVVAFGADGSPGEPLALVHPAEGGGEPESVTSLIGGLTFDAEGEAYVMAQCAGISDNCFHSVDLTSGELTPIGDRVPLPQIGLTTCSSLLVSGFLSVGSEEVVFAGLDPASGEILPGPTASLNASGFECPLGSLTIYALGLEQDPFDSSSPTNGTSPSDNVQFGQIDLFDGEFQGFVGLTLPAGATLSGAVLPVLALSAPTGDLTDLVVHTVLTDANGECQLVTLDPSTGVIVDLPADASRAACVTDLAAAPDGSIIGIGQPEFVDSGVTPSQIGDEGAYLIEFAADGTPGVPLPLRAESVAGLQPVAVEIGGLAYATDGTLYLMGVCPSQPLNCLMTVDPATGLASPRDQGELLLQVGLAECGGELLTIGAELAAQVAFWYRVDEVSGTWTQTAPWRDVIVGFDCASGDSTIFALHLNIPGPTDGEMSATQEGYPVEFGIFDLDSAVFGSLGLVTFPDGLESPVGEALPLATSRPTPPSPDPVIPRFAG